MIYNKSATISSLLSENHVGTFVTIGNLPGGFPRLLRVVEAGYDFLQKPIVAQVGHSSMADKRMHNVRFVSSSNFDKLVETSCIVVGHCGVGTLLACNLYGKRPALFPRTASRGEHLDDHQIELARKLEALDIADIVYPGVLEDEVSMLAFFVNRSGRTARKIMIHRPNIDLLGDKLLGVASVGGHRQELAHWLAGSNATIEIVTDAWCPEVDAGQVTLFPSCAKQSMFPIRLMQALRFLRERQNYNIITTGAGVGAIFAVAARALGRLVVIKESLTRLEGPSKWFRLARNFADIAYIHDWCAWRESELRGVSVVRVTVE